MSRGITEYINSPVANTISNPPTDQTGQPSNIAAKLAESDRALVELFAHVDRLEQELTPVLTKRDVIPFTDPQCSAAWSPYAAEIHELTNAVYLATHRLNDIIQRLDL